MFLSKKHISRRTVLKGVGATIALPLLDAMSPARDRVGRDRRRAPRRSGSPSSASRTARSWIAGRRRRPARTIEMSPILKPLEPFRKHLTIVSGLRNKPGETPEPHAYIESTWLTCVKPWEHGVTGPDAGVTADQLAARHIGQDTRLPSLELTTSQAGRAARVADADAAAAAGRQSARGVPEAVRPGRHRQGARRDSPRDRQHSRSREGAGRAAADQPRRPRPRRRQRLSRLGARDRAPRADGREGGHDAI